MAKATHSTNEITKVIDGELCRMVRRPEPLTPAERRGVRSFERLLTKIDEARDEDGNVLRTKAIRLVRKAIEGVPRDVLRGFKCALAEYIALVEEASMPEHGQVAKYVEHGEWFRVDIADSKHAAARGDPTFQRFLATLDPDQNVGSGRP